MRHHFCRDFRTSYSAALRLLAVRPALGNQPQSLFHHSAPGGPKKWITLSVSIGSSRISHCQMISESLRAGPEHLGERCARTWLPRRPPGFLDSWLCGTLRGGAKSNRVRTRPSAGLRKLDQGNRAGLSGGAGTCTRASRATFVLAAPGRCPYREHATSAVIWPLRRVDPRLTPLPVEFQPRLRRRPEIIVHVQESAKRNSRSS